MSQFNNSLDQYLSQNNLGSLISYMPGQGPGQQQRRQNQAPEPGQALQFQNQGPNYGSQGYGPQQQQRQGMPMGYGSGTGQRIDGPMGAYFDLPGAALSEQAVQAMFGDWSRANQEAQRQHAGYYGALGRAEQAAAQAPQQILDASYRDAASVEQVGSEQAELMRSRQDEREQRILSYHDEAIQKAEEESTNIASSQALGIHRRAQQTSQMLAGANPDGTMRTQQQQEALEAQVRFQTQQEVQSVVSGTQYAMSQNLSNMRQAKAAGMTQVAGMGAQTDAAAAQMQANATQFAAQMRTNAETVAANYAAVNNLQVAQAYQSAPMGFASMAEVFTSAWGLMQSEDPNIWARTGGVSQEFLQGAMGGGITYA